MTVAANTDSGDPDGHVPIAELLARQGIGPIASVSELADDEAFDSDAELEEFLADLYASRRVNVG